MIQPYSMRTSNYRCGVQAVDGNDAWALMTACSEGDLKSARSLIAKDAHLVNAQYWYQFPIHLAVREGCVEVVRLLLESGADPGESRYTFNSWQKLVAMAQERGYDAIHALLTEAMRERFGYSPEFETTVVQDIKDRNRERVLETFARRPDLVTASDSLGNTAIHWAVITRQLPLIDCALELGANLCAKRADGRTPILLSLTGDYWYRPSRLPDSAIPRPDVVTGYLLAKGAEYGLSVACALGDGERVGELLRSDSGSARSLDSSQRSPLGFAARSGYTEIARSLLDAGADPNAPEDSAPDGCALFEACAGNHVETAKLLLDRGANPNAGVDSSGCCLTIVELRHGESGRQLREALLAHGAVKPPYAMTPAELNAAILRNDRRTIEHEEFIRCALDDDGVLQTLLETRPEQAVRLCGEALWSDARPRTPESIRLAVACGFDANQSDWSGVTFLHVCAKTGDVEVARELLKHGADINAVELETGGTPLAWAARSARAETTAFLLEAGADPNRARGDWAIPLALATEAGHTGIADMLRQFGAAK